MSHLRLASERGQADFGWLQARYSFSFANYYDPRFVGFSALRVINEDRVAPHRGFATHGHQNMEILTYVLAGALEHQDSAGNRGRLQAGDWQYMSAGAGIRHSEHNPDGQPLHLLQIWIEPNEQGTAPAYQDRQLDQIAGWQLVASASGELGSFKIRQQAKLWRVRLKAGEAFDWPEHDGRYYLHQVAGQLDLADGRLQAGDALALNADERPGLKAQSDSESLVFALP